MIRNLRDGVSTEIESGGSDERKDEGLHDPWGPSGSQGILGRETLKFGATRAESASVPQMNALSVVVHGSPGIERKSPS